jgi:hypothetical protein
MGETHAERVLAAHHRHHGTIRTRPILTGERTAALADIAEVTEGSGHLLIRGRCVIIGPAHLVTK